MTYSVHSTATIPTASAQKYIDQLAKHWGHKCEVAQADGVTSVTFPFAAVAMRAFDDHLQVDVSTATHEHLAKSKEVFMAHIDRFAFREAPLAATWQDKAD